MNKLEIVKVIAEKTGLPVKKVEDVVNSFIDITKKEIKSGNSVTIKGFGTFKTIVRKERMATVPGTNKKVKVPQKTVPKFKPSDKFIAELN